MNIPTQETEEQKSKCITKGCRNYKHQGEFIGDLCAPCFLHITSGNVIPTESFVGDLQRELTAAQEELAEWSILKGWGGTPEIINDFIKGQQTRIHYAQNIEEELTAVTEQRDRLVEALRKAILWGDSASHYILHRQDINWTYLNEAKEVIQSINQPTEL